MSDVNLEKMKVAELKEELKTRGLDLKGTKAVLVKRLMQAMNAESGIEDADVSVGDLDTSHEDTLNESNMEADEATQETEDEPAAQVEEEIEQAEEATEDIVNGDAHGEEMKETIDEPGDGEEAAEDAAGEGDEKEADGDEKEADGDEKEADGDEADENAEGEGEEEEFTTIDETQDDEDDPERRGSKRARSRSHDRDGHRRHRDWHQRVEKKVEMEDDSWLQLTANTLDRYNSDLTLTIEEGGLKGTPITSKAFAFMWSGARGMYGYKSGKLAFQIKITEDIKVEHLPDEEAHKNVLRVGWSIDSTSLQLGEEPLSFGYGGTGKSSTDCKFADYGSTFAEGDVITAYLDLESDPPTISYDKNGENLGVCNELDKEALGENALFPHILTKNSAFECNFGQMEEPFFPLQEGYIFVEAVAEDERIRGSAPPAKKEECEMLMMVGLPGAGKTYWTKKHCDGNPDKKYNVLGTNNIIDKMRVMGLPRRKNYAGRWDVLIQKSTDCLNRMFELAATKRRNYILDQTNVYASARRRKMQPFEGFQRKAIVVCPTDEDLKTRTEQREDEEGKEVPEKAVLEMKANYTIPEEGQLFDSVEFVELDKEESTTLIETYVKEGRDALPPPHKRFRDDRRGGRGFRRGGGYDNRERSGNRGGYGEKWRGGSGGGGGYRGSSNWSGDRNRGGRDNRDNRSWSNYGSGNRQNQTQGYGRQQQSGGWNRQQPSGGWGQQQQQGWGNQGWNRQQTQQQQGWGGQQQGWGSYNQGYGNQGYGQWGQQGGWSSGGSGSGWGNQNQYGHQWGSYQGGYK